MAQRVLIIGGVATGMKAAARLRRRDPEIEITVLEQGEHLSYGACGLPYYIADLFDDYKELLSTPIGVIRDATFFKNVKGVTAHTKTRAEEIDRAKKIVRATNLETGEELLFPYDKLVLGTGGTPVIPPIEGARLNNIFQLSTVEDALAIKQLLASGKMDSAVVVGAGLIGMEMAEALDTWGGEVAVVEMLDWVFPTILDKDMGLLVADYLSSEGIELYTGEKVERFEGDERNNVVKVFTDKRELDADMVLLSIGVRPNVELARKAGLMLGKTGAIEVNEFLQTSDPDIYAGGDCAENVLRINGKKVYAPMGSTANKHGRVIADHIYGDPVPFYGVAGTAICKILEYNIARTGLSQRDAKAQGFDVETVICPGHDRPHFYPGKAVIMIKLIADKKTGKLLGAQIIGPGDISKRMDILVAAMTLGADMTQIAALDLTYAPPFSPAMDVVITAAQVMENKLKGLARSVSPLAVKERLDRNDDFILLDVRSPQEYEERHIDHPSVMLLPLGKLRSSCDVLPKDKEIVTTCQFSLRGYEAQRILDGQGFFNVKFMDGGMVAWPFKTVGVSV